MSRLEMFNQFARTTPSNWTKGCTVEVSRHGRFYIVSRPWVPPINEDDATQRMNDVMIHFSTQWDLFSWLSWWYS